MANRHACVLLMFLLLFAPTALHAQQAPASETPDEARNAFVRDAQELLAELQQPPQPAPQPVRQPGLQPIPPRPAELQAFSVVLLEGDVQGGGSMPEDIPPAVRSAVADMKDFLPFKSYRLLDFGLTRAVPGHHASISLRVGPDTVPPAVVMLEVQQPPSASKLQVAFTLTGTSQIDTTLTMEVGETVIVGTSRMRGDKGLIALLTALPLRK